jgi:SPP1 family predicted phage head-tail adaptor
VSLPFSAGILRQTITLRRPIETPTGKGGFSTGFEDVARIPAEVIALDGRESVMAHVLQGVSVYRIRIRYRVDIKPDWQIAYGGLTLNIKAPPSDPDGRRVQQIIVADTSSTLPN